jgi:phage FluMu gp28-like protein
MRDLVKDEETFSQEFLCVFLKAVGSYIPLELIAQARRRRRDDRLAGRLANRGALYLGIDIARDRDATIAWLDEYLGDVAWTRMVLPLYAMPFFAPTANLPGAMRCSRGWSAARGPRWMPPAWASASMTG